MRDCSGFCISFCTPLSAGCFRCLSLMALLFPWRMPSELCEYLGKAGRWFLRTMKLGQSCSPGTQGTFHLSQVTCLLGAHQPSWGTGQERVPPVPWGGISFCVDKQGQWDIARAAQCYHTGLILAFAGTGHGLSRKQDSYSE